jgi:hypothetical protein
MYDFHVTIAYLPWRLFRIRSCKNCGGRKRVWPTGTVTLKRKDGTRIFHHEHHIISFPQGPNCETSRPNSLSIMHHVPLRATVHTFENEEDYREDAILIFQPNVMFTFKVMFCQDSHWTLLSEVGSRLPLLYTAPQYHASLPRRPLSLAQYATNNLRQGYPALRSWKWKSPETYRFIHNRPFSCFTIFHLKQTI